VACSLILPPVSCGAPFSVARNNLFFLQSLPKLPPPCHSNRFNRCSDLTFLASFRLALRLLCSFLRLPLPPVRRSRLPTRVMCRRLSLKIILNPAVGVKMVAELRRLLQISPSAFYPNSPETRVYPFVTLPNYAPNFYNFLLCD